MKSSKVQKLMKETGLLVGTPAKNKTEYVKQVTSSEIDLVYTYCTTKRVQTTRQRRTSSLNSTFRSETNQSRKSLRTHVSITHFKNQKSFFTSIAPAIISPARCTSPEVMKREKFDFACFIMFWIKIGQKCFPDINNKSQAVLLTIE
jgi:hypothetical protein